MQQFFRSEPIMRHAGSTPRIARAILLSLLLLSPLAKAQTQTISPYQIPLQDEIKLPDATFQKGVPARFDLPALPQKPGLVPVLRARLFVQSPQPSGFNWNAHLEVNGTPLLRRTAGGDERLLERPTTFKLLQNGQYYGAFQSEGLAVMFAPSAAVADDMTDDKLGATFLLDLSDVARGVDNNVLEVFGHIPAQNFDPNAPEKAVNLGRITNASIGWIDKKYQQAPPIKLPQRSVLPVSSQRDELGLAVGKRGGFALSFHGARLLVETDLGLNGALDELIADDASAPAGSTPSVKTAREKNGDWRITANWSSGLQLERTLHLEADNRLSWHEVWRNAGAQELPVPFNHRLFLARSAPPQIVLGGNPDSGQFNSSPFNPTAFISSNGMKTSFGWVAEDDWLRALLHLANTGGIARAFSRSLALAPGKSITFQMSLQAQASDSYWDFINALRRRWNVNNVRLERPVAWGVPLKNELEGYDWIIGPWQGLQPDGVEAKTLDAQYKGKIPDDALQKFFTYEHRAAAQTDLKNRVAKIHESPQNRALVMMHPAMEVAYKPRMDLFPFTDETILTREGKPFEDGGYSRAWVGDATRNGWGVLYVSPRADNKYGRELLRRIHIALDDDLLDGMYSDEFTFAGMTRVYSRYDYRQSDGYSVILDDAGKIVVHATDNAIATLSYQLAAVAEIKKRNKLFLVNTAPATRALQNAGILHFVEAGNGFWFGANAHLTTPLQLGNVGTPTTTVDLMKISRRLLDVGTLHVPMAIAMSELSPGDNFIAKQFPITPIQLGAGFVIGRERIVSDKSGDFAWPEKVSGAKIWRYDANGKLLNTQPRSLMKSAARKNVLHLEAPENGIVIAEFTR
jgi:hypothetical protein